MHPVAVLRAQVKLHPWFAGLDWASLARQKAAFVPTLEHEFDTSYFASKPVRSAVLRILRLHAVMHLADPLLCCAAPSS
jgi:hypothetical protein